MTWTKTGSEFPGDCAEVELTDAAYRTHHEVIQWLYDRERFDCRIAKSRAVKVCESPAAEAAMRELVAVGFWREDGRDYEVIHQAEVIRQSLHAQHLKIARDRRAQANKRARDKGSEGPAVSADVSAESAATQTDRQTNTLLTRAESEMTRVGEPCEHGKTWGCRDCKRERESA